MFIRKILSYKKPKKIKHNNINLRINSSVDRIAEELFKIWKEIEDSKREYADFTPSISEEYLCSIIDGFKASASKRKADRTVRMGYIRKTKK